MGEHSPLPKLYTISRHGQSTVHIPSDIPTITGPEIGVLDSKYALPIVQACNAFPALVQALEAMDKFWTEDFPHGPDDPEKGRAVAGVPLHPTTIAVWQQIRAAIAKAKAGAA